MYHGFFVLCITNMLFFYSLLQDHRPKLFKLYPAFVGCWLVYHFIFSSTPIGGWSFVLGFLLGIGAISLYIYEKIVDKSIWIGIQPIIMFFLIGLTVMTSITIASMYFTLTLWSLV